MSRPPSTTDRLTAFPDAVTEAAARHLALEPAASMVELAQAAGVSRATLFRRFPSRSALVAELCVTVAQAYLDAVAKAEPERGAAPAALQRVVEALSRLAPVYGLLGLQPLESHLEASLLAGAAETEERLRRLVRRGQTAGEFRVDVDPDWVLTLLTWSLVGVADSVRLGRLTSDAARRHLLLTLTAVLARPE